MHAIWRILLDKDFVEAYKNGIVVRCFDGVTRRVYPRIFTYSADYPEKYVVCHSIRFDRTNNPTSEFFLRLSEIKAYAPVHDV